MTKKSVFDPLWKKLKKSKKFKILEKFDDFFKKGQKPIFWSFFMKNSLKIMFWPEIWSPDRIKVAVDYFFIKFGPTGAFFEFFGLGPVPGFPFFDKCFLDFDILALLKAIFDKLDR